MKKISISHLRETLKCEVEYPNDCEKSLQYTLTNDGILTISGEGKLLGGKIDWEDPYYIDVRYSLFKDMDVREVIVEEGVQALGVCCFANCRSLKKVTLPSSLKEIGYKAFWECSELSEIITPENLQIEYMGMDAFACTKLMFPVEDGLMYWGNQKNPHYVCLKRFCDGGSTTLNLHDDTVVITDLAFSNGKYEKIVIPQNVRRIGHEAFLFCQNLSEVVLPEGLVSIGDNAFAETSIQTLKLPSTLKNITVSLDDTSQIIPYYIIPISLKETLKDDIKELSEISGGVIYIDEQGNVVERLPIPYWLEDDEKEKIETILKYNLMKI